MKMRAKEILIILVITAVWGGCVSQAPDGGQAPPTKEALTAEESEPGIVATVDEVHISAEDLNTAAKGQLQKLMAQVYQVKKAVLDGMIADMLIEKAAKAEGKSTEDYLAENVDERVEPPTDEEIKGFYDKQKGRIKKPFEEMKPRIADYLKNAKLQAKRRELVAGLRKRADVKVMLEPPRTEIPLDGAAYTTAEKESEIVLVEFSDYECPYSMRAQATVHRVLEEYAGKITYAFFDYPLAFHQKARKAHEAARCAGEQGKYPEYGKKLFENQRKLGVDDLKKYAGDLGLDTEAFNACLDSGKASASVQKSFDKGSRSGVSGTPAFFVNGIMISGAQPFEKFQEIIQAELTR
jgi:protein-disulfide isomerase